MVIQEEPIKRKIQEKGIKLIWIAKQLNIKQSTLSMYLSGQRTMPEELNNRIADLINR